MTRLHYIQFTFINNYSRRSWVYIVGATSETFEIFKRWRKMVEKQTNSKISCVHTNMGSEYMSAQNLDFCKLHGSQRQLSAAYTPQQNDIVERKNRYLLATMRDLLSAKHLPIYLGEEVVHVGNYIFDRVRVNSLYKFTPHEVHSGQKPNAVDLAGLVVLLIVTFRMVVNLTLNHAIWFSSAMTSILNSLDV